MTANTVYIQEDFDANQAIQDALAIICGQIENTVEIEENWVMNLYKIYAKPLQNNIGNETIYIQSIMAKNKKNAIHSVRNMIENRGFYNLNSYIAIKEN